MTVVWVVAVLLGLLFEFLFLPIRMEVCINSKKSYGYLRIFCFKKKLFPLLETANRKAKPEQSKPPEREKQDSGEGKQTVQKKRNKRNLSELIELLRLFLDPAPAFLQFVTRGVQIQKVRLIWRISSDDAAQTAILYGRACAAVVGLLPLLKRLFRLQIKQICVYPDFCNEEPAYLVSFRVQMRLYRPLLGAMRYLLAILKGKWKLANRSPASMREAKD